MIKVTTEVDEYKKLLAKALHDICLLEEVVEDFFNLDMAKDDEEKKYLRDEIHDLMEKYFSLGPIIEKFTEASSGIKADQDS